MKKTILIIILLCFPFIVNAKKCDDAELKKNMEIAEGITYTNDYNSGRKNYTVTLFGIPKDFYIKYKNKKYTPTKNSVVIPNVPEGTNLTITVENDDCGVLNYIYIEEKYYNNFYGSSKCIGYENKIVSCTDQFTSVKVTEDYLEKAIYNYNNPIITESEKTVEYVPKVNIFDEVKDFAMNWGIKILLVALTSALSITFYSNRFKNIKHKI